MNSRRPHRHPTYTTSNPFRLNRPRLRYYPSRFFSRASFQPAGDIITARMRAMLMGIEGTFQEGHELDDKTAKRVPKAQIGKILSRKEATALLKRLGSKP
jgi:hypothetical protein